MGQRNNCFLFENQGFQIVCRALSFCRKYNGTFYLCLFEQKSPLLICTFVKNDKRPIFFIGKSFNFIKESLLEIFEKKKTILRI